MKTKLFFVLAGLLFATTAFSQEKKEQGLLGEVKVSPPEFVGVEGASILLNKTENAFMPLNEYVATRVEYPTEDADAFREGKVIVQFTVQPDGKLTDYVVINSVSSAMDEEVIRVLQTTSGMWKPGYNNNKAVPMSKEIVVTFKLAESSDFQNQATHYFVKGSKQLLVKQNPQRAIRYFDRGIVLLPNEKCLLLARGMSRYEIGDKEGACRDWNRIKTLGGFESETLLNNFCELSGYAEMMKTIGQ